MIRNWRTSVFLSFVNKIWPGNYDVDKTRAALSKTLNITAYDGQVLVGCLRILYRWLLFWNDYRK